MKKFLMLVAIASSLTLTACPAPGTSPSASPSPSTNTGTGATVTGRFTTKAEFIAWLNCLKTQASVDAQAKSAIDLQISAVNLVPDANWAQLGVAYGSFFDTYSKLGTTCN